MARARHEGTPPLQPHARCAASQDDSVIPTRSTTTISAANTDGAGGRSGRGAKAATPLDTFSTLAPVQDGAAAAAQPPTAQPITQTAAAQPTAQAAAAAAPALSFVELRKYASSASATGPNVEGRGAGSGQVRASDATCSLCKACVKPV